MAPLEPEVVAAGVAALWISFSGTGGGIVVGQFTVSVTVVGVVFEVDAACIAPVFPLTPRPGTGASAGTVLLWCGPGGLGVPGVRRSGVGDCLLSYRSLGLEGSL